MKELSFSESFNSFRARFFKYHRPNEPRSLDSIPSADRNQKPEHRNQRFMVFSVLCTLVSGFLSQRSCSYTLKLTRSFRTCKLRPKIVRLSKKIKKANETASNTCVHERSCATRSLLSPQRGESFRHNARTNPSQSIVNESANALWRKGEGE
jgi:hypothetical protein